MRQIPFTKVDTNRMFIVASIEMFPFSDAKSFLTWMPMTYSVIRNKCFSIKLKGRRKSKRKEKIKREKNEISKRKEKSQNRKKSLFNFFNLNKQRNNPSSIYVYFFFSSYSYTSYNEREKKLLNDDLWKQLKVAFRGLVCCL